MQAQTLRRVGNSWIGIGAIAIGLLLTLIIGYLYLNDRESSPSAVTTPGLTSAIDELVLPYSDPGQPNMLTNESGRSIDHLVLPFVDPNQPNAWAARATQLRTIWDYGDIEAEMHDQLGLPIVEKTPWDFGEYELIDRQ